LCGSTWGNPELLHLAREIVRQHPERDGGFGHGPVAFRECFNDIAALEGVVLVL
jgi:hypothetical protein